MSAIDGIPYRKVYVTNGKQLFTLHQTRTRRLIILTGHFVYTESVKIFTLFTQNWWSRLNINFLFKSCLSIFSWANPYWFTTRPCNHACTAKIWIFKDIHTTLVKCLNLAINNLTSTFSFKFLNAYFSTMVEDSQALCSSSLALASKTKFPLLGEEVNSKIAKHSLWKNPPTVACAWTREL